MESYRKLYRSTDNRVFAGVASGLAEYMGASPTLIRILFIILFLVGGGGGLLYILLWALTPRRQKLVISFDDDDQPAESTFGRIVKAGLCAVLLIAIGSIFEEDIWIAAFVIGLGIGLYWFWKSSDRDSSSAFERTGERGGLYRSMRNKKLFGIFGGLAERTGIDATLLRVIGVVLVFAGAGVLVPIYFLCAVIIPKGDPEEPIVERVAII